MSNITKIKKPSKILSIILIALILPLLPTNSFAALSSKKGWFFDPYFGFDLGSQSIGLDLNANALDFDQPRLYLDSFLGARLNKHFAAEFGIHRLYLTSHGTSLTLFPYSYYVVQAESAITNYNANAIFYYPIYKQSIFRETSLIATVGTVWQQVSYADTAGTHWNSGGKPVARLGIGAHQMITRNFGIRVLYVWENTSQLGDRPTLVPLATGPTQSKDNHIVSLGFFISG